MDLNALRQFIHDQPGSPRYSSSFWLHDPDRDETRLVNAMRVREAAPLPADQNGVGPGWACIRAFRPREHTACSATVSSPGTEGARETH